MFPKFSDAIRDFRATANVYMGDLIGTSHSLADHHKRMSPVAIDCDMETLRAAMLELNTSFAALDAAYAPVKMEIA